MEAAISLLLISMFLMMLLGYFILSGVSSRRLSMDNSRAVIQAERYMAQVALAKTRLAQNHGRLQVMARKLDLSAQELARLNEMKSKFLSIATHDIRSPLATIRGFSLLLSKKMTREKEKAMFGNIVRATDLMNVLISDLTDLAMIEAGKLTMQLAPFDLRLISSDIIPGIRMRGAEKGVQVIYEEASGPIPVCGDRLRLAQVLMNLLNNALKFTPSGGAVQLRIVPEGAKAAVYVKDSGIGIHPSETKKVFEKFYQAEHQKNTSLRRQGWGLGLSISAEIIAAHKGDISATSPGLGKGSTFYYRIPSVV